MSTTIHEKGGDHVINGGGGGGDGEINGGGGGGDGDSKMRKKKEEDEEKEEEKEELLLPYLNEDIVTKIIVKTPAEARVNRLRYVCKPWYNIINNDPGMALYRLLTSKSPCLVLQTQDRTSHRYLNSGAIRDEEVDEIMKDPTFTTCFIKMGIDGIGQEEYDLSPPFKKLCIKACANGLMLAVPAHESKSSYLTALYVVNPLTNQQLALPFPFGIKYFPISGFIFLPSIGEYKVVVVTRNSSGHYIQILTLPRGSVGVGTSTDACNNNVDDLKWSLVEAPPEELKSSPLAINEIFYWVDENHEKDYIVSFDTRVQKFSRMPHKFRKFGSATRNGGFIEMGGYLCFWLMAGLCLQAYNKLDIWILIKDSFRIEWTKLYSITMDPDFTRPMKHYGQVALSFGNGEVIIFRNKRENTLWAYNLKLNQWWKLGNNLKDNDWIRFCRFHVNKTVDLKSLFATEVEVLDLKSLFASE